jgi:prevent-host-death family protein
MQWQMQQARRNFSQLVQRALDEGPQVVTRRGQEVVVVLSVTAFRRLTDSKPDLRDFLLSGPDLSVLDLERVRDLPREVGLGF